MHRLLLRRARSYHDADSGASEGIAVTATSGANGTCAIQHDGRCSWNNVGSVSNTSALLLRSSICCVSFRTGPTQPLAMFIPSWDQTAFSSGNKVDTSTNGGTSPFSTAPKSLRSWSRRNDAPVLDNTGNMTLTTITETRQTTLVKQSPASSHRLGVIELLMSIVEPSKGLRSLPRRMEMGHGNSQPWWLNLDCCWHGRQYVALLLRSTDLVRFVPNGENATSGDITFRAWDQTTETFGPRSIPQAMEHNGLSSATEVASITVTAINDVPLITVSMATFGPILKKRSVLIDRQRA